MRRRWAGRPGRHISLGVAAVVAVAVAGCAYREVRYELAAEAPAAGGEGMAKVVEKGRERPLLAERVVWRYSGALAPTGKPGGFRVVATGTGTVDAEFPTPAGTRSLSVQIQIP
ncbi:MAG: hypothetical protein FJZ01_05520 [Candidatus Sericytochromatia bacterium]|nr:hypothetical protein [Candidatus Tanganyikabacteria bacterium]